MSTIPFRRNLLSAFKRRVVGKIVLGTFALALSASGASAQFLDTYEAATNLGTILAAESFCGFQYQHSAITGWIDQNIRPDDMSFPDLLSVVTDGAVYELQNMGQSQRVAHCHSVERIARHYGFID